MGANRNSVRACVHDVHVCMSCFIVVTVLGERVPGPALQAPHTKDLSVLPSGI